MKVTDIGRTVHVYSGRVLVDKILKPSTQEVREITVTSRQSLCTQLVSVVNSGPTHLVYTPPRCSRSCVSTATAASQQTVDSVPATQCWPAVTLHVLSLILKINIFLFQNLSLVFLLPIFLML